MNELEEIVKKMIAAGESEENIALVIQHYNDTANTKEAEIPKGDEAEVVSGVSDSTLAEEGTSSESKAAFDPRFRPIEDKPKPTKEEVDSVMSYVKELNKPTTFDGVDEQALANPELSKEKSELKALIASRPIVADNSKEEARIKEIDSIFDELSAPKKSLRRISNEKLDELDKQLDVLTTKAVQLAKGTSFSFETILKENGTYQDIIRQKNIQENIHQLTITN